MLSFRSRAAAGALVAAITATTAGAQEYPQTLYWGSGLIDIPVAWVAPLTGDFAINYSGKRFEVDPSEPKLNYSDKLNSQLTASMAFFGRVELGVAAFSSNPEQGFFARGLLLSEDQFRERGGAARFLPGLAVGVRNVGPYERIDRFGAGYSLLPPNMETPNAQHVADEAHQNFKTSNTFYGVASKNLRLQDFSPRLPDFAFSLTVGYGNGLFEDDGGLGDSYSKRATGGLFYGIKSDYELSPHTSISVMAENNAWDYNAGVNLSYRGVRAGLYLTEIGAGSAQLDTLVPGSNLFNYQKFAFTIGWQSNIFALLKGDFLQNRAAALERERQGLLAEIEIRRQRVAQLELELQRYEAQNLLELEQRRAQASAELQAEREALRRLEERLRRIEQQAPPAPAPPPRR